MGTLYENIRARRVDMGMSQDELAKKMGYTSRSSIAKIETGVNDIPQSKISEFAEALDTTTSWLMGWEEAPSNKTPPASSEGESDKQHVLKALESLPEEGKAAAMEYIQFLLAKYEDPSK